MEPINKIPKTRNQKKEKGYHDSNGQTLMRGFSLIEMMVVSVLAGMIFYGIFMLLRVGSQEANTINTRMTIQDSAREGLAKMLEELRETTPTRVFTSANFIMLYIPQGVDQNGQITWSSPIHYYVGGSDGKQLIRQTSLSGGSLVSKVVANDIKRMTIETNKTPNPSLVTVQLDFERQTVEGRLYTETLIGQGKARND